MGIYLGQLPPAEIARLKAELAETLTANFCYPRFFDHRSDSLQMRPVDRSKRQEVWLYLSSVDFTSWSRVDLASSDFQNQIERLFIQFVQRNRSFFGEQGRRRMADIRMLISTCAQAVSQRLRDHLSGPKSANPPFGSPRPVVSWSVASISGRAEPAWEQIAASTMVLQQQLQEVRGESKPVASPASTAMPVGATNGSSRPVTRPQTVARPVGNGFNEAIAHQMTTPTSPVNPRSIPPVSPVHAPRPAATAQPVAPVKRSGPLSPPVELPTRKSEPLVHSEQRTMSANPLTATASATSVASPVTVPTKQTNGKTTPLPDQLSPSPVLSRSLSQPLPVVRPNALAGNANSSVPIPNANGQREILAMGEDDNALFEQLRLQLLVWLRVEAVKAGLDISDQNHLQLLDMLRQHARVDETRLQVVSTLLNIANQVSRTSQVSVLDYKQVILFLLMHTRV